MGLTLKTRKMTKPPAKISPLILSTADISRLNQELASLPERAIKRMAKPEEAIKEVTAGRNPSKAPWIGHKFWYL